MEDLALTPSAAAFLQPEVENRLRRVISLAASYAHHRHGKAVRAADIKRAASIITPSSCATLAAIWQGAAQTPTPSAEQQDQVAISQASAELLPSLAQLARKCADWACVLVLQRYFTVEWVCLGLAC